VTPLAGGPSGRWFKKWVPGPGNEQMGVQQIGVSGGLTVASPMGPIATLGGANLLARDGTNGALTADLDAGTHKLINVVNPANPQDAATKAYVDASHPATPGLATVLAISTAANAKITALTNPTDPQDAATKAYVDASHPATSTLAAVMAAGNSGGNLQIKAIANPTDPQDAATRAWVLSALPTTPSLAAVLAVGNTASARIVSLTDPVNPQDAATKFYVDATRLTDSAFRVVTGAGATVTLADSDFPTAADPRPVLIVLGATTTSVVVPVGLTQPAGAFINFLQGSSQATFSVSGGATLIVPLATENKSGGANTQQVLTSTAVDAWVLGGRTSA